MERTGYVSVNGLMLHTKVEGAADAPWMVFSNSLASTTSIWDGQVAAFAGRYRLLRYDQRGHGVSQTGRPETTTFEDLSADLLGLLDYFGIEKAVLVGVSMGAVTVLRAAARAPERCVAVIACDGAWQTAPGSVPMWRERIEAVTRDGMQPLARPTVARWFRPDFIAANPEAVARIEAMVATTNPQGYLACVHALMDYDHRADFPGLGVPALFMAGADDGDMPQTVTAMAAATPGSRLCIVPNCGHQPQIEQPQKFCTAVMSFLDSLA